MARSLDSLAPPSLGRVLCSVEAVNDYSELRLADDFAHQLNVTKSDCDAAASFIDKVLADPGVSNSEIKGLLNRAAKGWGATSPFGADAKAARAHLQAARDAIVAGRDFVL